MGDSWDRATAEFLPRFERAANASEYALAVSEVAARIPDGHVDVSGGWQRTTSGRGNGAVPRSGRLKGGWS